MGRLAQLCDFGEARLCHSPMRANAELERLYREVGRAGLEALDLGEWPRSASLLEHCVSLPDGSLAPRRFARGEEVVACNALLGRDPAHVALLTLAQRTFRDALQEARERCLSPESGAAFANRCVRWCAPESWHAVVAVFSECPALLPARERASWAPVPADKLDHALGTELRGEFFAFPVPPVRLRFHGYRVCADGALIACFLDAAAEEDPERGSLPTSERSAADEHSGGFLPLRERSRLIAARVLGGPLTSRPKNLIHVTLGRVLRPPPRATESELESFAVTVRWLAARLHAGLVPSGWADAPRAEPGGWRMGELPAASVTGRGDLEPAAGLGEVLEIDEVSLTLEKQWWMEEYDVLAEVRVGTRAGV